VRFFSHRRVRRLSCRGWQEITSRSNFARAGGCSIEQRGSGGVHWNAEMWRSLASDFVLKGHLTERYGNGFLPEDMTIQDRGITYDELEPHYDLHGANT
jgi:hypothetical protein